MKINITYEVVTEESAEQWLNVLAPEYCAKGYFMDKSLTPDSFKIVPASAKETKNK